MKRPTLGAALVLGLLGSLSVAAPALAASTPSAAATPATPASGDGCAQGLDRLGQQVAALEAAGPGTPAPVTPQEIAQLRALQQGAQGAAQQGNAPACQAILGEALALQDSISHPRAVAADELEDAKLRSPDGADLGSVSELIIDPNSGRVAYAVVELGGFLGLGESHFPVPWALFTPSGDGYVLNVPKDKLTNAPRFSESNRPNMNDRQWAMAVHTYYGITPYWTRDGATLASIAGATGGGNDAAQPLRQEVQRLSQEVARLNRELQQARGAAGSSGSPPASGTGSATPGGDSGSNPGNAAPQPPVSQQ